MIKISENEVSSFKEEKKKERLLYILLLHHLNNHISNDFGLQEDIEIMIKTVLFPEDVILQFLIYLMRDDYQCNLRHSQNKIISLGFQRILIHEEPSWKKLRESYPISLYIENEPEDSKQACKAAASAYCAYTFINPPNIIEASKYSCFNEKSFEFQSRHLFELLKYGE